MAVLERTYKGYTIYSDGSILKKSGKGFVKQSTDSGGYAIHKFCYDGTSKTEKVHTILWKLFNGPIPDGMTVDHIDGNKSNNDLSNLRLLSRSENSSLGNRKLTDEQVKLVFHLKSLGWLQREIAEEVNVTRETISYILNKKLWYTQ